MGNAKVTFRFDTWKEGNVAPSTIEIPVVEASDGEENGETPADD